MDCKDCILKDRIFFGELEETPVDCPYHETEWVSNRGNTYTGLIPIYAFSCSKNEKTS